MNTSHLSPAEVLRQISQIQSMEPGKLCVMRQGKKGSYYNHQYREGGRAFSRYVPRDQVEAVRRNTANYQTFQTLVEQYAQGIVAATRAKQLEGKKKRPMASLQPRTRNFRS